jgi:hypothetical protein
MNIHMDSSASANALRELSPSELAAVEGGMSGMLTHMAVRIQQMLYFLPPLNLLD